MRHESDRRRYHAPEEHCVSFGGFHGDAFHDFATTSAFTVTSLHFENIYIYIHIGFITERRNKCALYDHIAKENHPPEEEEFIPKENKFLLLQRHLLNTLALLLRVDHHASN